MAYLKWTDDLETGIPFVDQDHKILVDLLNQAHDCIGVAEETATLGSVINALVDYTEFHFVREERLMAAADFPDLIAHCDMHRTLSKSVQKIRVTYATGADSIKAQEVVEFLRDWLINHILKQDFRYRASVLAAPESVRMAWAAGSGEFGMEEEYDMAGGRLEETFKGGDGGAAGAVVAAVAAAKPPEPLDFSALSVLVVDDNPNFQMILRTILNSLGCPFVTLVDSGRRGLEAIENRMPELILVDWRMDGMDGLDFARHVRGQGVQAPIVMISGYGEPGLAEAAHTAGVDAFLEKPITARALIKAVGEAMAARSGADGAHPA